MTDNQRSRATISGVFHAGGAHFGREAALARQADVTGLKTLRGVLRRLGDTLDFPDWYGGNLDALVDCLGDDGLAAGHCPMIAIAGLATLQSSDTRGFATLLEVLGATTEARAAAGRPLAILLDVAAPGLPELPAA